MKRLFETGDNTVTTGGNPTQDTAADFDFEYRKYSLTSGWTLGAATDIPGKQDFAAVTVDFGAFLRAPETYTGAMDSIKMAGGVIMAGLVSMMF